MSLDTTVRSAVLDYHRIKIILGTRRSGKTNVIKQIIKRTSDINVIVPTANMLRQFNHEDLTHANLMTVRDFAITMLLGRQFKDKMIYCFDEFLNYPEIDMPLIFTGQFNSFVFTGTPDSQLLCTKYQHNIEFFKKIISTYNNDIAFFELKREDSINEAELSVYNTIIAEINDVINECCISYTKFDIILGDDYENNGN